VKILVLALLLSAVTWGCSLSSELPQPSTSTPAGIPGASPSPELTHPPVLAITPTPPPSETAAPFVPFTVSTWADNVVLHDNPGHLSTKLGVLPDNTPLTALGRTPGGEWLMVKTADNRLGWVFAGLVETSGPDMRTAPLVNPTGVITLRGRLTDEAGSPVNGVQFAVLQAGVTEEIRTDAMTDDEGIFYAFLPADSKGSWWVEYTAISCESSVMDATCSNWSGAPEPKGMYVQLPGGAYTPIQFTWK